MDCKEDQMYTIVWLIEQREQTGPVKWCILEFCLHPIPIFITVKEL